MLKQMQGLLVVLAIFVGYSYFTAKGVLVSHFQVPPLVASQAVFEGAGGLILALWFVVSSWSLWRAIYAVPFIVALVSRPIVIDLLSTDLNYISFIMTVVCALGLALSVYLYRCSTD